MDIDHALLELASAHHFLLTKALVASVGVSDDQWRRRCGSGAWVRLVPGVWHHAATPVTFELRVRAGALWLGKRAALYGTAAPRWQGLDGCESAAVEFLMSRRGRYVPQWLVIHTTNQWDSGDVITVDGVRTCTATRAIIDMASTSSPREVEAAIDSAIRLRRTSVPTLTRRIGQLGGPGRTGTRLLRALLLDSGGESYLERAFLRLVRTAGLPQPTTQVTYRTGTTKDIRVDFEYVAHDVVIEVSGKRGHSSESDRRNDIRRRNHLTSLGKAVVEFTTADVLEDPEYVLTEVRQRLPVSGTPRLPLETADRSGAAERGPLNRGRRAGPGG